MSERESDRSFCSDCSDPMATPELPRRRDFLRTVGGNVAALVAAQAVVSRGAPRILAEEKKPAQALKSKPAEALIRELHAGLNSEQEEELVLPWNDGAGKGKTPTRMRMYNRPLEGQRIGEHYSEAQQELIRRILRSICADDDGFRRLSKDGKWDASKSFDGCGCHLFGDPSSEDAKFAWLFTGHHLTVRCDGNSAPGEAFGGPMYYGHLPSGYSEKNVFFYQTKRVLEVFEALDEGQRKKAIAPGTPGERARSIRFRPDGEDRPGLAYADLGKKQRKLVEGVMRDVLSPYRKEDVDEVMQIVKANGGMEKLHLAFYEDAKARDGQRWHFWRLEGPGFVWNYRVLPHVHCYVHIASRKA